MSYEYSATARRHRPCDLDGSCIVYSSMNQIMRRIPQYTFSRIHNADMKMACYIGCELCSLFIQYQVLASHRTYTSLHSTRNEVQVRLSEEDTGHNQKAAILLVFNEHTCSTHLQVRLQRNAS
jgi:hypothetical protein